MRKLLVIAIAALGVVSSVSAQDDDRRTRAVRLAERVGEPMDGVWRLHLDHRQPMNLWVWQRSDGHWVARTFDGDTLDRVYIDPHTGRFDFYELDAVGWQWYRGQVRNGRIVGRFSYYQDGPYHDPRTISIVGAVQPRSPDPFDRWEERRSERLPIRPRRDG